jgi:hypothetical protein
LLRSFFEWKGNRNIEIGIAIFILYFGFIYFWCCILRERRTSEAETLAAPSVDVRGFACALAIAKGVSGWRPKTPTGLSENGLPSKDKLSSQSNI